MERTAIVTALKLGRLKLGQQPEMQPQLVKFVQLHKKLGAVESKQPQMRCSTELRP